MRIAIAALALCGCLSLSDQAHAWGTRGHGAVGVLAVERLQPATRDQLGQVLGATDFDAVVGACNWSDTWRDMGDGRHTAPWHFVNIEQGAIAYSRSRDCPNRQCVPEAVNEQAGILGDPARSAQDRRLAFKHLCHFTGDLHQPLHVAYADDEGGNLITVRYRGEAMKLHHYWDAGLINRQVGSLDELLVILRERPDQAPSGWSPLETYGWTNESFALARNFAYPPVRTIDEGFEKRSWQVTLQQLDAGSGRLAAILESVLGQDLDLELETEPEPQVGSAD